MVELQLVKKKTKQTGNYAFRTLIVLVSMAIK